jgi:hypothetical protein
MAVLNIQVFRHGQGGNVTGGHFTLPLNLAYQTSQNQLVAYETVDMRRINDRAYISAKASNFYTKHFSV